MRIIHTADWHIGQTLAGWTREHEHRAVLADLIEIVRLREADAVIVTGDVFDHQNPSGESQRLFYDTLLGLKRVRPSLTIVVTAGNHDAAGRLEAPHPLLQSMDVHVVGNVRRREGRIDAARHLVPLRDGGGRVQANVLAVSYPTAGCLPIVPPDATHANDWAVRALYDELMVATCAARGDLPLIVTGHLHVAGGLESEGAERRVLVGGQHAVAAEVFPSGAAYVALGHLHRPQAIGRETIRYSGSLLPLSATEMGYQHGVTLLTLAGAQQEPVATEHIPLLRPVAFQRVPEKGQTTLPALAESFRALGLAENVPPEQQPFVQVWLARDGLVPGYRAEVERVAEAFPVRLLEPRLPKRDTAADGLAQEVPIVRLAELAPEELFARAFERAHDKPPEPRHVAVFWAAADAAQTGS